MPQEEFAYSTAQLAELAADALKHARAAGATDARIGISESFGAEIRYRDQRPESVQSGHSIGFGVRVFIGGRHAAASCNSLHADDIEQTVAKSVAIARHMQEDECRGLPDQEDLQLEKQDARELDLWHPWEASTEEMVKIAREMLEAAAAHDQRISRARSEGSWVTTHRGRDIRMDTRGFQMASDSTNYSVGVEVIADVQHGMETNSWGDDRVDFRALDDHREIARIAAKRAVARDGIRPLANAKVPVLFENTAARTLINAFIGAIQGEAVHHQTTCFGKHVGEEVFASHFSLREDPFIPKASGSAWADREGVRTQAKDIVKDGVLQGYLCDCFHARKLKLKPTGNSGGYGNLRVACESRSFDELLREMGTGLLVTGLMGRGSNIVTGDYSNGAIGFWVENGAIAYPVKDATIAGRLPAMLKGIVSGGDDILERGSLHMGSLLIDEMTVAGAG